ncbi:hypothetical protein [Paenibacillus sp. URB8-2]|uniref:hypothetical protein n=1 Tax=Paenibacillus sp. URB8-2 TaxID=2741301 RepID=UPI0015C0D832|nr:hypothetical protein [Paenibacillus sp. URB8-2]
MAATPQKSRWQPHRKDPVGGRTARVPLAAAPQDLVGGDTARIPLAATPQESRWQPHRKISLAATPQESRWLRISFGLLLQNGESAGFFEQKRESAGKTCYGAGISGFSGWIGELNRQ